jgi:hypothetical protein
MAGLHLSRSGRPCAFGILVKKETFTMDYLSCAPNSSTNKFKTPRIYVAFYMAETPILAKQGAKVHG